MSTTLAILGPTASGKSAVAMELARRWNAQIVSVDSMQVYKEMDIGTAKPTALERREVPHHMVDLVEPDVEYSVADFQLDGRAALGQIEGPCLVAGGSGLHFRALVDPLTFAPTDEAIRAALEDRDLTSITGELLALDPEAASVVDLKNRRRAIRALEIALLGGGTPTERHQTEEAQRVRRYESFVPFDAVGVDPGNALDERIKQRLGAMIEGGLVSEVRQLRGRLGRTARAAVGYAEILKAETGKISMDDAFEAIATNTRKLARRQRTWFQRDPRIRWIPWTPDATATADRIEEILS